ncbi:hypothetical protein AGLY_013555 [Aphis glycines]|uniref:Uncharacterized protein n=1 Tax=Aphis glycines TaxID=307491 RepID=A0A6G0T6T9_APHGL|nr:hypothetical protein AGLY_013555 [Aphis glycines]
MFFQSTTNISQISLVMLSLDLFSVKTLFGKSEETKRFLFYILYNNLNLYLNSFTLPIFFYNSIITKAVARGVFCCKEFHKCNILGRLILFCSLELRVGVAKESQRKTSLVTSSSIFFLFFLCVLLRILFLGFFNSVDEVEFSISISALIALISSSSRNGTLSLVYVEPVNGWTPIWCQLQKTFINVVYINYFDNFTVDKTSQEYTMLTVK